MVSRKRFYRWLFSLTLLFVLISLYGLFLSQPGRYPMWSGITMGMQLMQPMFNGMSFSDWWTPMRQMMDMNGMVTSNPLIYSVNLALSSLLFLFTALLTGMSIIYVMIWRK